MGLGLETEKDPFEKVWVLLHHIEGPVNLGAIARAMANTGFHNIRWTGELQGNHHQSMKFAVHAKPLIADSKPVSNFQKLIEDMDIVYGFSPRTPWQDARNLNLDQFLEHFIVNLGQGMNQGLLFGNEATGLENQHLSVCNYRVVLPSHAGYQSMNLSQAVMVVLWELRRQSLPPQPLPKPQPLASPAEKDILVQNLHKFANDMAFLNPQNPEKLWQELAPIFKCRSWSPREVQLLNSLFSKASARYMALKKNEPSPNTIRA